MIEWLGIGHLFELSQSEAIAGFLTPLVVFAVFFLVQIILPGKWVPGYVINSDYSGDILKKLSAVSLTSPPGPSPKGKGVQS